mmetsp:Transcript_7739/g.13507  ORF Transcript_7739/g.13507 Transcript_7739/m.13507 type:complete len:219 (+) Transcript_7739:83-739(+)
MAPTPDVQEEVFQARRPCPPSQSHASAHDPQARRQLQPSSKTSSAQWGWCVMHPWSGHLSNCQTVFSPPRNRGPAAGSPHRATAPQTEARSHRLQLTCRRRCSSSPSSAASVRPWPSPLRPEAASSRKRRPCHSTKAGQVPSSSLPDSSQASTRTSSSLPPTGLPASSRPFSLVSREAMAASMMLMTRFSALLVFYEGLGRLDRIVADHCQARPRWLP